MTRLLAVSMWLLIFLFPLQKYQALRMMGGFPHLVIFTNHTSHSSHQSEETGKESESFRGISRSWDTGNEPDYHQAALAPSPNPF